MSLQTRHCVENVRKSGPIRIIFVSFQPWVDQCTKLHQNIAKIGACRLNTGTNRQASDGQTEKLSSAEKVITNQFV